MSPALVTDLARRIDDVVAEPTLARRIDQGRLLRLWIAAQLDPFTPTTPPPATPEGPDDA